MVDIFTMKTEVIIRSYAELFELWSTNESFRKDYPYLSDLRLEFYGKLDSVEKPNGIEYYLMTGYTSKMTKEEVEKYMYPYFDNKYVRNNEINISRETLVCSEKKLIKYILHKKLVVNGDISWLLSVIFSKFNDDDFIEFFKYAPRTNNNGSPYDFIIRDISKMWKMYKATQMDIYKPTAHRALQGNMHDEVSLKNALQLIKEYNCEWIEKPDTEDYKLYNFIKSKNGECDIYDVIMFIAYDDINKVWRTGYCKTETFNRYFIGCCKKFQISINTKADNGSYLVHYAAQQYKNNPNWLKELLDYGARIVDDNGELLTGWLNKTIYDFCSDGSMFDFLLDYYKDNQDILPKLHKVYIVKEEPKKIKSLSKFILKSLK